MEQLLPMSLKQLDKLDILRRVARKELTQQRASHLLHVGDRHVRRMLIRLKEEGPSFLQHGLKGRSSNNTLSCKEKERIKRLLLTKYPDFGPALASEKLREEHGIFRDPKTIARIRVQTGLQKPRQKRKVVTHRFFRERRGMYGEMQQFDGSYHNWFENRGGITEACLLASIDDATGKITHARFEAHEGVLPVMNFWLSYACKNGLPKAIYLDRFSTYSMNMVLAKENPDTLTQFERAAKETGIKVIHAMSPQAKGRVERLFRTLQDRLVKEMRLHHINTTEEANVFLSKIYIPDFNKRFSNEAKQRGDLHRIPSKTERKDILPYIFCRREPRTIQHDFTIPYKTQRFQLLPTPRLAIRPKEKVLVHELPSGTIHLLVRGKQANYHPLQEVRVRRQKQQKIPQTLIN